MSDWRDSYDAWKLASPYDEPPWVSAERDELVEALRNLLDAAETDPTGMPMVRAMNSAKTVLDRLIERQA